MKTRNQIVNPAMCRAFYHLNNLGVIMFLKSVMAAGLLFVLLLGAEIFGNEQTASVEQSQQRAAIVFIIEQLRKEQKTTRSDNRRAAIERQIANLRKSVN
jgi:hypothetical protein